MKRAVRPPHSHSPLGHVDLGDFASHPLRGFHPSLLIARGSRLPLAVPVHSRHPTASPADSRSHVYLCLITS